MEQLSANFKRAEFACKCGCGFATVDVDLLILMKSIRLRFGEPVTINSSARCEAHNKAVGGADNSKHRLGLAADITVKNVSLNELYKFLDESHPMSLGLGRYDTFVHVDVRFGKARW